MPGLSALGRDQAPPSLLLRNTEGSPAAKGLREILRHVQLRPRTKVLWPTGSTLLQPTLQASGWCHPQLFLSTLPLISKAHCFCLQPSPFKSYHKGRRHNSQPPLLETY